MTKQEREEFLLKNGWEKLELTYGHYIFIKGNFRVNMDGFIFEGLDFLGHFDESYKYIEHGN